MDLLTALTFALWPLGRVHDVPVSTLFREATPGQWRKPRRRYVVLLALSVTLLLATVIGLAYDRRIAGVFVVAAALTFVLLRLVAIAVMATVKRLPRPRSPMLRLALSNISRPGAITPSVVLSLGLGLALLVTVVEIDGNLRRQFTAALPERAPSFFFIDIPANDAERFDAFLKQQAPQASLNRVPMLRGRIISANGVRAEDIKASPDADWVLESDRGITYADDIPNGSRLVEGTWWGKDYAGPPLVSFEKKLADGLGPEARRRDRRQRDGSQRLRENRQYAHGRLAEPRHQFRAGVLAERLSRRAPHPHRHAVRRPVERGA